MSDFFDLRFDQALVVLWCPEWSTCHHIDDALLSIYHVWMPQIAMDCPDWRGRPDEEEARERSAVATSEVLHPECRCPGLCTCTGGEPLVSCCKGLHDKRSCRASRSVPKELNATEFPPQCTDVTSYWSCSPMGALRDEEPNVLRTPLVT